MREDRVIMYYYSLGLASPSVTSLPKHACILQQHHTVPLNARPLLPFPSIGCFLKPSKFPLREDLLCSESFLCSTL